jgi:RNA polymerase sigma-70 factor (ECF subfamily)
MMASYSASNSENTRSVDFTTDRDQFSNDEAGGITAGVGDAPSIGILGHSGACQPLPCDNDFLAQARLGNPSAFVELCQRCSKPLERIIFSIVRNRQDTDDLLQETILSAYEHLSSFQGNCKFDTWVKKIGINKSLMLLRKRKARPELLFCRVPSEERVIDITEYPDFSPNAEQICANKQVNEVIKRAVSGLPKVLRDIFEHYYGNECSLAESANALGLTVAAAKSRLMRARRTLRRSLGRPGNVCISG